jgi:hypothetical protein
LPQPHGARPAEAIRLRFARHASPRSPAAQVVLSNRRHYRQSDRFVEVFDIAIVDGAIAFADGLIRPDGGSLAL